MQRLLKHIFLAGALCLALSTQAQITEVAAQAVVTKLGQRTVKSVLDELEQRITNISAIVGTQASLTAGNTVTSADAALRGLMNSLADEKNKTIDQLDQERALALADVYIVTDELLNNRVPQTAAALNVMVVRDMNHLGPLLASKTPFMVGAVSPTVLLPKDTGDYTVTVLGVGIGKKDGEDYKTEVTATFPGDARQTVLPISNTTDGIKFRIPLAKIAPTAKGNVVSTFPLIIKSQISCGFLNLKTCDYSFPFELTVFPTVALKIDVEQQGSTPGIKPGTERLLKVEHVRGNGHGKEGGPWVADDYPLMASSGYSITRVNLKDCSNGFVSDGNFCAFVYMDDFGPYPRDSVSIHGTNNSGPIDMHFNVYEAQKFKNAVPLPSLHYEFGPEDAKFMEFDSSAELIGLNVQMPFAGRTKYVQLKPASLRADDPILCTAPVDLPGGKTRYSCQVHIGAL
ncbi:MAG: hypothetical protein ACXV4B_01810 [Halobacteriota archaeon]